MYLAGLPTDAPPRIEVGLNRDRSPLPPCIQSRMFMTLLRSSRKWDALFIGLVRKSAGLTGC